MALAMVACGLTGDNTLTPARIARWAQDNGCAGETGTSWDLMSSGCGQFGLQAQELALDEGAVFGALQSGRPIICSMRPGDFTTAGHFIVLTGVQDGKLRLLDRTARAAARSCGVRPFAVPDQNLLGLFAQNGVRRAGSRSARF